MSKGMIWIVDDEEDVCFLLKRILNARGYLTKCYFSLKECRENIQEDPIPNVVLLDINLTDGNGLRLLDEKVLPIKTKVFVMSARTHLSEEALAKGADRFIAKPFSPIELVELIEKEG